MQTSNHDAVVLYATTVKSLVPIHWHCYQQQLLMSLHLLNNIKQS